MISIVCVYHNSQILSDYLTKSLEYQTSEHEVILVDNTERRFRSAAQALNHGGKLANGKYIMFVHQDVDLSSNSWLEEAEKVLDSILCLGIAGVTGMSENGKNDRERGRNMINHGEDRRQWELGNPIDKPEHVQTLDECLVIVPKSVFNVLGFDEVICDDWHLYTVDYCLNCAELGLGVYVLPMSIYHRSDSIKKRKIQVLLSLGALPSDYYRTLGRLRYKHRRHFKRIYTTCGYWSLSYPVILQRIVFVVRDGLKYLIKSIRLGERK